MRLISTTLCLYLALGPAIAHAQGMCGFLIEPEANKSDDSALLSDIDNGENPTVNNEISLSADSASLATNSENIAVQGNVVLDNKNARVTGNSATYDAVNGEFRVNQATYAIKKINARGNADSMFLSADGIAKFNDVKYTTCPEDDEVWSITAKKIKLDLNKGMASVKNAALRYRNVPILYLPYATYPISDRRKSGFLIPELRTSNQRGVEISTPWYWNIAPNYDATITPRYMSKRGLMIGGEGRMLNKSTEGVIGGDFLRNDDITQTNRYLWNVESTTAVTDDWRVAIDATGVSDDRYLNDFASRWTTSSQTALDRSVALEHYGPTWDILLRLQDYQTIDELLPEQDEPYIRLPQLAATGDWRNSFLGANYRLETETTYFTRNDDSLKGMRLHVEPEISYEFDYRGIYIIPKAGVFHTNYNLQNTAIGQDSTQSVTTGVYSIDSGATFERIFASGTSVTLEPRAQYVYVPYENQDNLPVFDTILPDTNLIQLFEPNRYLRYDRIGDTSQLNLGFTSRVFGGKSGREILTAAVGTAHYYSDQKVVLPDEVARTSNSGDYLFQARVSLYDSWNLDAGYQWNAASNKTEQGNIRLQLKPLEGTVVNAGYRYQSNSQLDQGDFSFAWAVSQRWNLLGRAVYSFEDEIFVDQFGGIEYETCCWGVRVIYRQRVSRDIEEDDTSVGIQFILKGFTDIGNSVRSQLESGILGYADL